MTTQGDYTLALIEGGEALIQRAEYAVNQALAGVALFAGERVLSGEVSVEHTDALQRLQERLGDLINNAGDGVAYIDVAMQDPEAVMDSSKVKVLDVEVSTDGADDDSEGEQSENDDDSQTTVDTDSEENLAKVGESNTGDEVDPQTRARQESVLIALYGRKHADEIADLSQSKIKLLGDVAASIYSNMELHPRAIPARDERVDQIQRIVANGESSSDVARDYNLTPGAPKTSVDKAVEIMRRDVSSREIEKLYQAVVND